MLEVDKSPVPGGLYPREECVEIKVACNSLLTSLNMERLENDTYNFVAQERIFFVTMCESVLY